MQNTVSTVPSECQRKCGELKNLEFWQRSFQRNWRMASELAWMRRTPKVVAAITLIILLWGMGNFLKNMKEQMPLVNAKN